MIPGISDDSWDLIADKYKLSNAGSLRYDPLSPGLRFQ